MAEGAGIILLNSKRQVLLFLRDDKPNIPYPNMWDLIGGYIERGETPEQALERELAEKISVIEDGRETPLAIRRVKDCQLLKKIYGKTPCGEDFVGHIFIGYIDLKIEQLVLHEGQRLNFFSAEELEHLEIAFNTKPMILKCLK